MENQHSLPTARLDEDVNFHYEAGLNEDAPTSDNIVGCAVNLEGSIVYGVGDEGWAFLRFDCAGEVN